MKLCSLTSVKIGLLQILIIFQMSEACLDLLVRSFNQIFTPVIETSEDRIHKSHRVDDLTKYYKRDQNGNFVLRDDKWLSVNPFVKNTKPRGSKIKRKPEPSARSLFEHLNAGARTAISSEEDAVQYLDDLLTARPTIANESEPTGLSNSSTSEGNITISGKSVPDEADEDVESDTARKVQFALQDYDYNGDDYPETDDDLDPNRRKTKFYVPGERPIVDFLISILEMFQKNLGSTSSYLGPHSRTNCMKSKIQFRTSSNGTEKDDGSDQ